MSALDNNFEQAKKLINSSQKILLTMHERMDGDDGGSVLALALHLKKVGKQVKCVIKFGVPPELRFLPGSSKISANTDTFECDLLIVCGCSTPSRIGLKTITELLVPKINIDHHPDNTSWGEVNLVNPSKSSVAELVYDFFSWNKWPISRDIATCLLTGIITDTGSFMHGNTQSSTLKTASELMSKGAMASAIVRHTYKNKDLKTLKAWGRAIDNSYYDKEAQIIYSVLTDSELKDFGKLSQSAFEGLTETLNKLPEAKFALFIRQDGDIIKGSLRSEIYKQTDVSKIAKLFGGGGHKQAAGFSVAGKLIKDEGGQWKIL